MKKGVEGHLNHSDDLYDLPDSLGCTILALKLDKALIGNVDNVPKEETERMRGKFYCLFVKNATRIFPFYFHYFITTYYSHYFGMTVSYLNIYIAYLKKIGRLLESECLVRPRDRTT